MAVWSLFIGALLRRSSLDPDRRRFSLGTSTPHRASDASLDPHHAAMLFRDSRGLGEKERPSHPQYTPDSNLDLRVTTGKSD
uniref:Uncharacterized protein n=1 Tax=Timema monikensis TaxID=170555 RepID=A0A7R9EAP9_9NEOP|nr:unnamed protein product [Timema monikensis]